MIIVAGGPRPADGRPRSPSSCSISAADRCCERSVDAFDAIPTIAEIVVVCRPSWCDEARRSSGDQRLCRSWPAASGGRTRSRGIASASPRRRRRADSRRGAAVRDAPLIDRVIDAARAHRRRGAGACRRATRSSASPPASAIVAETIPRRMIWLAQTPQGFRRDVFRPPCARRGRRRGHRRGDARRARRVSGARRARRRAQREDHDAGRSCCRGRARAVRHAARRHGLRSAPARRRPAARARPASTIPFERGPLGHSDGDVGVSCADRCACSAPPAPATSASTFPIPIRGGRSAGARSAGAGRWRSSARAASRVGNVDVTVILERPKLAPHIEAHPRRTGRRARRRDRASA